MKHEGIAHYNNSIKTVCDNSINGRCFSVLNSWKFKYLYFIQEIFWHQSLLYAFNK